MENIVEQLKEFIVEENKKLALEIKQDIKQDINENINNLRQEFKSNIDNLRQEFKSDIDNLKQEFKSDIDALRQEFKQDIDDLRQEMNNRFFVFETEFGRKIDIMYDYMMLQREIYQQKFENLRDLDKRMDIGEIRNLDYEKRISILERK